MVKKTDNKRAGINEMNEEEVENLLDAWEKHKKEFPKLPFPRNYTNEAKFGTDWLDHLMDLDRDDHVFEHSLNVAVLMEQFCWFVQERKEIPLLLSSFVARAFHDFLRHGKSLDQAFFLKGVGSGQKIKRDYDGNPFPISLGHYFWAVIVEGIDPVEAKKIIQKEDKVKKSTLNDYIDNKRLVQMAIFNLIASVEAMEYRYLNEEEQKRIADIIPDFKYIPHLTKENLQQLKEIDETNSKKKAKEEKVEALKKQFGYDKF